MATINYENKEAISVNPTIPNKNKVVDSDMNLIKQVGNQILTTMGVYTDDWSSSATYLVGDVVVYDNRYFKNLTGTNTATTPDEDTTNWLEVSIRDISGGAEIPIQNTAPANPREDDLWIDTSEEGFDNSNVVNQYSDSTTDVYSCNYVNKVIDYSSSEQVVGKWYNGDTLYRKCYYISALGNTTTTYTALNITNLKEVVKASGMASNGSTFFPLPCYRPDSTLGIQMYVDNLNGISITTGNDRTGYHAYIVIEYTKTS